MKFKIKVDYRDFPGDPWWETYDKNIENPEEWGRNTISSFNSTLRPGERACIFLGAEIIESETKAEHSFEKTNWITKESRGRLYDEYVCTDCGVTARRYGIGGSFVRDHKYKAKVYARCDAAKAHLEKKRARKTQ